MSPVMTAFSPREEMRTLVWPGVWPGVGSSHTSPVSLCPGSTRSARPASITGRTESSIGFWKSGLAKYMMCNREWDHLSKYEGSPDLQRPIEDSVRPVIEAGLADLVEPGHKLTGEVWLEPTPGHTPGHTSVRISSRGENAVITGDMIHHPIQVAHPEWVCEFDTDPTMASETRRKFVERYCDQPVQVIGTHFAGPTSGHIVRRGGGFRFEK